MKQILQSLKNGETILEDVPCPKGAKGQLLIETIKTLVSAGTERMLVEFGKASLIGKVKQQPEKVKAVIEKIKTDGLSTTLEAVKSKLDHPIPLGYCNVGRVIESGIGVSEFKIGDRIISNGSHAEVVRVPKNLCARVPDNVTDDEAVFTVIAAIALQGVRLCAPTLGERFAVIGLGVIGLITIQILRANGCYVLAADLDSKKCQLAKKFGAETVDLGKGSSLSEASQAFTNGNGIDAVIISASTKSNEPLHQAAKICRKRGRIVLVGVIGSEFSREDFYKKELTFQVSCSYGPGRYDHAYEQKGQDYPLGFVRWTQQRNFETILMMMSSGGLNVKPLISHNFSIDHAVDAYSLLDKDDEIVLGIILNYPRVEDGNGLRTKMSTEIFIKENKLQKTDNKVNIGLIGSGNYGARILAPIFKKYTNLISVVSNQGVSGKILAKKLSFQKTSTDEESLYKNPNINVVVIATRHNLHAKQVISALKVSKHVFVEKPLALTLKELEEIQKSYDSSKNSLLMIGFNRRFAPQIKTIKKLIQSIRSPKSFILTINAGYISSDHWTQDANIGGGRIVGEACHFIDLLRFLVGSKIDSWHAVRLNSPSDPCEDKATITLCFKDGSVGTIHYLSNGHKSVPKERLEVFTAGKYLFLDNFRKLVGLGWSSFKKQNLRKQDKGQDACVEAFVRTIHQGGFSPISFEEIMDVSRISIEIAECLRQKVN